MQWDLPFILVSITLVSGLIWLVDRLFIAKRRKPEVKAPWAVQFARDYFPVFFLVLILRSFVIQNYRVPTGSLEPTVLPNDFLLVNQFVYGLKLPVWENRLTEGHEPKRGDIVVFHWPVNPQVDFIKRLIGMPGDHISYHHKILTINGHELTQHSLGLTMAENDDGTTTRLMKVEEDLPGKKHDIFLTPDMPGEDFQDLVVPPGMYFMMGDNRDNSDDSRYWGFVPASDLVGRAEVIWLGWDSAKHRIPWEHLGEV